MGKKLTLFAIWGGVLGLSGFAPDLHAESNQAGSRQAALHISLVVMSVVQVLNTAPSLPQKGSVTYNLDTTPREKRYDVRVLPPDPAAHADKQDPAVLRTLVIVPQ